MTYADAIDYLFTRLPMFQRTGNTAFKKDLTNINVLVEALGNPQQKLRTIHVAGTNGKGTTCHLLAAALQAHGFRVGMYTSPHYRDFRERIKINGEFIPEAEVVRFLGWLREQRLRIEPSFFEITVAMAFDYFARQQPDWVIVEVGLGGRLDSTNLIVPELSVITNIGLDHTELLGETLPEIAFEKGGIIKPGVPVVVGEHQAETAPVFTDLARAGRSQLVFADRVYRIEATGNDHPKTTASVSEATSASDAPAAPPLPGGGAGGEAHHYAISLPAQTRAFHFTTDLSGPHLTKNLLTAYSALLVLAGDDFTPSAESIRFGWRDVAKQTYYIGRWQILRESRPLVIADSAHNAEGLSPVLKRLRAYRIPLHIVLGVVQEKDLSKALPLFPREATYYFVKADVPRGLPADRLRYAAAEADLTGKTYPSVAAGYAAARKAARTEDGMVFVGGSIFTVAEVL